MKNRSNYIITLIIILLTLGNVNAQEFVNESDARKFVTNFISANSTKSNYRLDPVHIVRGNDNKANLYIYNIDDSGFVIISAYRHVKPILAYSFENSFGSEIHSNAEYFIENYNNIIDFAKTSEQRVDKDIERQWKELEYDIKNRTSSIVDPLLSTKWNQDCYYNEYAPYDSYGPCNRAYAGCVACAMSQIMKYWDYPATGKGSHSYNHPKYGNLSADFSSTTYEWDNMPNEIWSHNDAIATLMYQCGVSVDMNYGHDGSGAYSDDVETALRMYFGYSSAKYKTRSSYSDEEWISLLKSELDESRPMYFSGSGELGAHAIVCDGYDNNDYFHFNMGWSGAADGFYSIDDVYGFYNTQAVVIDIRPLPINSDENGIIYVTADGEGDGSSWENATSELQCAVAIASDGNTQVWVKSGTYYGDTNDNKGAFCIYQRNRVYGGFAGNESPDFDIKKRDIANNPTILDGENQRRVMYQHDHFRTSTYSIWDGFTIQNGNAGSGGGLYLCSNSNFYNCKFINNQTNGQGGAVYSISAIDENSRNIFENCLFENNTASMGGAIFDMIGMTLTNNKFINNTASTKGGAYYVYINKEPKICNNIFADNNAKEGGAIYNRGNLKMTNCNIIGNSAHESKGGIYNENKYNVFYNSIFWNNNIEGMPNQIEGESNFINCAIEGGFDGTNIIDLSSFNNGSENTNYPMFKNPDGYDFELDINSPLINAGINNVTFLPDTDINYGWRIGQGVVDIGAYEYQGGNDIEEKEITSYQIYPNPIRDHLIISGNTTLLINIHNLLGQKIYSDNVENNVIIDTSEWDSGLYFVNINGNIYKIVK